MHYIHHTLQTVIGREWEETIPGISTNIACFLKNRGVFILSVISACNYQYDAYKWAGCIIPRLWISSGAKEKRKERRDAFALPWVSWSAMSSCFSLKRRRRKRKQTMGLAVVEVGRTAAMGFLPWQENYNKCDLVWRVWRDAMKRAEAHHLLWSLSFQCLGSSSLEIWMIYGSEALKTLILWECTH